MRSLLVAAGEPAVTGDVGIKDRGELPGDHRIRPKALPYRADQGRGPASRPIMALREARPRTRTRPPLFPRNHDLGAPVPRSSEGMRGFADVP